ncbi:MAG: anthranilate synthase component I family protein [Desulfotomaculaceae bacterium]|nr:anthranilate synthase component I family protein [Desulfotomaculaceae bacterium]
MIRPDCGSIQTLAGEYRVIPICREIYADLITPITLLRKFSAISKRCFLLESVEGGEKWGRYSFLGLDPLMRVYCKEHVVTVEAEGELKQIQTDHPYEVLREIHQRYKSPRIPGMPPFTGGFVGYLAYAMIDYAEPKLSIKRGEGHDFDLMLFDKVIAYDHLKQKICIVVNLKTDRMMENYGKATAALEKMAGLVSDIRRLPQLKSEKNVKFTCNVSKEEYCQMVKRTKEYIREGDIFQAVISRQFVAPYRGSLLNAYRVLRTTNPSPYMVYLKIDEDEIMSSSPETLVRLQNGRLVTFPVAGSRPRGKTEAEDQRLANELLADEKELSEHNMLVDLSRNDLGKISQFSSVEVTGYQAIHRYSTIMHICSQVESNILPGCDGYSAIEAVLPAGTLSGAPKIRACEIINELESEPRGIYGGALGYLDFTGNMDTCIAIRMAVKKNDKVYVQAGAGIVADSVPEKEYEESGNKARAVINAICRAAEVDD